MHYDLTQTLNSNQYILRTRIYWLSNTLKVREQISCESIDLTNFQNEVKVGSQNVVMLGSIFHRALVEL